MAMTLRLPAQLDAGLDALASVRGESKQQVIVTAIADFLERHAHAVEFQKSLSDVMTRHAGVIDKLSRT